MKKIGTIPQHSSRLGSVLLLLYSLFPLFAAALYAADTAVTVNAGSVAYTIPDTLYGCNLAAWAGNEDGNDPLKNEFMKTTGRKFYRWPGGSWGDAYIWDDMEAGGNSWVVSYAECLNFLSQTGGTMQPIVNCGGVWNEVQHTNAEAVAKATAWVTDMNITRKLGVKYWEIGNELFGSWEAGYCATGTEYAQRYCNFYRAMKAVDSTIKLGAVACETEDAWNNWMATMLAEFKSQGIVPDFLVIHCYPTINQTVSAANDALCLSFVDNIGIFTKNLDAMVTKYFGASYVGKIEYTLTEFSATPGDHVYLDAMFNSQMMLECAKYKWTVTNPWMEDIWYRNGYVTPTFYIFPLLQYKFGRQLVTASSDNALVRAYAAKDDAGNLTLFLVNNSPSSSTTAAVSITGFTPASSGEKWIIEPVHTGLDPQIPASTRIQEWDDVKINGIVHPDPRLIDNQVWPTVISTGASFTVALPASAMAFVRVLPGGKTPVPHPAATPTLSPTPSPPPPVTGPVKLQYKCMEPAASATSGRYSLNIVNTSSAAVSLSDIVVRYWYTREGPWGWEAINCDWAATIPTTSIWAGFFNIYNYVDIHLGSGSIAAGSETGEIQIRWNYGDFSVMDQSNDYSFSPTVTNMTDYMKITLYKNGILIWGTEPAGLRPPKLLGATTAPTPTPTPTAARTVTPTPGTGIKGDVNDDGQITIVDALMVAQYSVGLDPAGFQSSRADVNCDGSITIVDALMVAQRYVGLTASFPC